MRISGSLVVWLLPAILGPVACGARTALDLKPPDAGAAPSPSDASPPSCAAPDASAPTCSTWQVAGPDRLVSESTNSATASGTLGSVIPVGCGVMLSWTTYTYVDPQTSQLTWTTRTVAFDGTPTGPENLHAALSAMSEASGAITLAASATGVGAMVADEDGCRFLPLDLAGADTGPPVAQPGSSCVGLASRSPGVFTYLVADGAEGATPTSLVAIDGSGNPISTTPLGDPASYALWGRLVYGDGSFLLNAFREDPTTDVYSGVLQHFDAQGNALSPAVAQPANAAPLMLAVAPGGALASWWTETSAAAFVALDPSGAEAGAVTTVPFAAAPYGEALASTPSGDVFVTLLEDAIQMNDTWTIYVQEHAPDGTPRGPLVALPSPIGGFDPGDVTPIVAADGLHALVIYVNGGIHTVPLVCAD
jgi:hypothetical protein